MIELEFIKSQDIEVTGKYLTHDHEISIGFNNSNDIIIKEKNIAKHHLKITVEQNSLYVENIKKNHFFFSNGKKISGRKKHKIGDEIGLCETTIKIANFKNTNIEDQRAQLQKMYNDRCKELPQVEELFTFFKNELMFIQNEINKLDNSNE